MRCSQVLSPSSVSLKRWTSASRPTVCNPTKHALSITHASDASRKARGRDRFPSCAAAFPPTPNRPVPLTRSRTRIPSSPYSYFSASAISSVNTKRGIHSDIQFAPPRGRQTDASSRWELDTIQQPDRYPVMTTLGTEPVPVGPDPRINYRHPLSPPRDLAQTHRATSPAQGSLRSSLTAVHNNYDRLKPTAIIKRYERSTKLEPPFIGIDLSPLTTSFADG